MPTKKAKKVFVIGGGPAGMEAARVAAVRGHQVTLFERKNKLGGQLLYAVLPPYKEEWNTFIKYLRTQLRKLRVNVKLNEECTVRIVDEAKPDALIVATGAIPLVPDVPGVDGTNVNTAIEVLTGSKTVGQNVVIIGGGSIGCETAEFLLQMGKRVTILEMLDHIGTDIGTRNRWIVIDRLSATGVRLETNAQAKEITSKGVKVTRTGRYREFFEADSVVIAAGMKAVDKLTKELEGKVSSLYQVGDCTQPGKVREAIVSGFQAALQI